MESLDLGWKNGGLGKRLSNLFNYPFVLDDVRCGSIEGFLQSLKFEDEEISTAMAEMWGYDAYKIGQNGNDWVERGTLIWCGVAYERVSVKYTRLIERAYDACFDANPDFRAALFETGVSLLTHHIGRHDQRRTTLTQSEYILHMYRLRAKAQQLELEAPAS